jgi:hypothetical protein
MANITKVESSVPLKSVAMGVRYQAQFRVRDYMGTLTDAVLRAAGSPFTPTVFPYSEATPAGQNLYDPETANTLRIDQQDTLLEFRVDTDDLIRISELGKQFQTFILEPLHKICGVSQIMRYGVLVKFDEKKIVGLQYPSVRYKDPDLPVPKDFGLRFSHRLPTSEGYFRKNVSDYRNLIYSLVENSEHQISLSLDYQEYFSPMLESSEWNSHSFSTFIEEAILYHKTTFANWVQKLRKTERAA